MSRSRSQGGDSPTAAPALRGLPRSGGLASQVMTVPSAGAELSAPAGPEQKTRRYILDAAAVVHRRPGFQAGGGDKLEWRR